jgi:hypothetical protein
MTDQTKEAEELLCRINDELGDEITERLDGLLPVAAAALRRAEARGEAMGLRAALPLTWSDTDDSALCVVCGQGALSFPDEQPCEGWCKALHLRERLAHLEQEDEG